MSTGLADGVANLSVRELRSANMGALVARGRECSRYRVAMASGSNVERF